MNRNWITFLIREMYKDFKWNSLKRNKLNRTVLFKIPRICKLFSSEKSTHILENHFNHCNRMDWSFNLPLWVLFAFNFGDFSIGIVRVAIANQLFILLTENALHCIRTCLQKLKQGQLKTCVWLCLRMKLLLEGNKFWCWEEGEHEGNIKHHLQ